MVYNSIETIVNKIVCRAQNAEFFQKYLPESGVDICFAPSRPIYPNGRSVQELAVCPDVKEVLDALHFPLILKPRISSTVSYCHNMVIVPSRDALFSALSQPQFSFLMDDTILVQEYFENHFETLIKLYTIGDRHAVSKRQSIAKKFVDKEIQTKGFLAVKQKLKSEEPFVHNPEDLVISEQAHEMLKQLTVFLNTKLGLHLIGLDICVNEADGKYYIFDCNFFSSYDDAFQEENMGDLILEAMRAACRK